MNPWEANIRRVIPYTPGEQPDKSNIIKLNTNENPYPPSPKVAELLTRMDTDSLRLYPDPNITKLTRAIASCYDLTEDNVFVGVGSDDVLAMSFLTFFHSNTPILFPDITYSFYDVWAKLFRIPYETVPLDEKLQLRCEDYRRENGGVVFPNPNAPTGELLPLEAIDDIISHNQEVVVIVDEAYIDFGGESARSLLSKYDNLLVVQTFSKSRSMAGMRIGYAMGSPELIRYLNDVKYSFNSYTLDRISIEVGTQAVLDREYFETTRAKVISTREWTKKELRRIGFRFGDSMSNFIFATHPQISAKDIFMALRERDIYVRHFSQPKRIDNYLRISIGTDSQMKQLIAVMETILKLKNG